MEIHITNDKSPTLYRADIDEHYHSMHGAIAESTHVYIDSGLLHRNALSPLKKLRVFEVGFGTGLNAVLAAMTGVPVEYVSIEKYPLSRETINYLNFGDAVDSNIFHKIHSCEWNMKISVTESFDLFKLNGDLLELTTEGGFDVIFMDAFAPEKQPELWTVDALKKLSDMLSPNGVLTTYCAKGNIRRTFQSFGLKTERLPGPPEGKREILRVSKPF